MENSYSSLPRRAFCVSTCALLGSAFVTQKIWSKPRKKTSIPLGFDNFSIRALGWNAQKLLEYAGNQKVESILFSDLDVYDSFEQNYLVDLSKEASRLGIVIQVGTGGICPTSKSFKPKHGSAVDHLKLLIRVAKHIGSNVARCYLGSMKDRLSKGGIQQHVNQTVQVLKKVKKDALDAGVTIAVENHAGDLHSRELIDLIERAGTEYVGATIDSGNATWTLENPLDTLRNLAPYAVSSGIRDSMVWQSERGVKVQWTAMGEGCTDLKTFTSEWQRLCPKLPMQLETISGFAKEFPFLDEGFWPPYSNVSATDFSRFLLLSRKGKEIPPFTSSKTLDRKKGQQQYQLAELEKSLKYCKQVLGVGSS